MYIYESHLGGNLYTSYCELDYEELYCEQCGDHDWIVGFAATKEDAWELLKGGWDYEYIKEFIDRNWNE